MRNIPCSSVNQKIKSRRIELGLRDTEVADQAGFSIYQYGGLEDEADYVYSVAPLYYVKKLCKVLDLNLLALFDLECAFCTGRFVYENDYRCWRSTLVNKRRESAGFSLEQLGDKVGFNATEIELIETYVAHLESWVIANILQLSGHLYLPPQILLDVQCSACKR